MFFFSWLFNAQPKNPLVFEENALNMTWRQLLFFSFKYYCKNYYTNKNKGFITIPETGFVINENASSIIKVNIGGDLMPYKAINQKQADKFWDKSIDFWNADIVVANLETPIDSTSKPSAVPEVMLGHMNFNASLEQFNIFNKFGLDVLSLANNHTLDMGYQGLEQTLDYLSKLNIQYCGVGINNTTCIKESNGIKVGFLSFTYSLNHHRINSENPLSINLLDLNNPKGCDIQPIVKQADELKQEGADLIIALLHCGNAYQPLPGAQTQRLFNKIALSSKIDVIVGGHPHNVQPFQYIENEEKKVFIAYSLGDFVAYDVYQRSHLNFYLSINIGKTSNDKVVLQSVKVQSNVLNFKTNQLELLPLEYYLENNKNKKANELKWLNSLALNRNTFEQQN